MASRRFSSFSGGVKLRLLVLLSACLLACLLWAGWRSPTAWLKWGLWLRSCPPGQPIPVLGLEARVVARGEPLSLRLQGWAALPERRLDGFRQVTLRRYEPSMTLLDDQGQEWSLEPLEGWQEDGPGVLRAQALLPAVPDGDYLLRARAETPMGVAEAQADLAL